MLCISDSEIQCNLLSDIVFRRIFSIEFEKFLKIVKNFLTYSEKSNIIYDVWFF